MAEGKHCLSQGPQGETYPDTRAVDFSHAS